MEINEILTLMEQVGKAGLSEFCYEKGGEKLIMKLGISIHQNAPLNAGAAAPDGNTASLNGAAAVPAGAASSMQSGTGARTLPEGRTADPGLKTITAPMVGTFYVSSSPEKAPFVKAGDSVKRGDTVCVIEAMKLMNEIESKFAGTVEEILAENESVVEFGQPLFKIREAV